MAWDLTPEISSSAYTMRDAREEDVEAMVALFNEFADCRLYRTLYPGLQDPSQLSEVNRKQLLNWLHSPQRQLNVLVYQETQEVVAFCQWALDDSADLPYDEKYYQGPGSNPEPVKSFLVAIRDYDDRLCDFGEFIYIDWLIIHKAHRNRGLLAILLSWGWRFAVLHQRYILLDPIEETVGMWNKMGCRNLTGSTTQLNFNCLGQHDRTQCDEQQPKFRSYQIGSKGKAHTIIQPMIFDLNVLGKTLSGSKWMGRPTEGEDWHSLADIDFDLKGATEYVLRV